VNCSFGGAAGQPMKKNRQNADTYRFDGHQSVHAGGIHSVEMAGLDERVEQFGMPDASSQEAHAGLAPRRSPFLRRSTRRKFVAPRGRRG
jgi:hypothetical protein